MRVSLEMIEGRMRGKEEHSDYISSELDLQKGGKKKKCWLLRAGFPGWVDHWF